MLAGFATPETYAEDLLGDEFENFFTVFEQPPVAQFTELQHKKFFVLYALFLDEARSKKKELPNFFEFAQRYLDAAPADRQLLAVDTSLRFALAQLRTVAALNPALLAQNLSCMHASLLATSPEALHSTDKAAFLADSTLNETRDFLASLEGPPEAVTLAMKILLLLGNARGSAEDLLAVADLLETRAGAPPVLTEEVLKLGEGQREESAQLEQATLCEREKGKEGELVNLQLLGDWKLRFNVGAAFDGTYAYLHARDIGLLKIGTGAGGSTLARVYAHNRLFALGEKCKLVFLEGRLLCRSSECRNRAFVEVDRETL